MTKLTLPILFIGMFALPGCTSLGKGFAEALLEKQEEEDLRICQIWGNAFDGIASKLNKLKGKTKVLMVHGVGDHIPGHATLLMEGLA